VIRAGFGIFYSAIQGAGAAPNISRNYPFLVQPGLNGIAGSAGNHCPSLGPDATGNPGAAQNYTGNPNATLENGLAGPLAQGLINFVTLPAINGRDAVIQTPYTMNYNLTLQHAFTNSMSATIGDVGNVSRHLETLISSNPAMALVASGLNTQFVQPFPQFTNSNFNTKNSRATLTMKLVQKCRGRSNLVKTRLRRSFAFAGIAIDRALSLIADPPAIKESYFKPSNHSSKSFRTSGSLDLKT
jgi:hypothetical protein